MGNETLKYDEKYDCFSHKSSCFDPSYILLHPTCIKWKILYRLNHSVFLFSMGNRDLNLNKKEAACTLPNLSPLELEFQVQYQTQLGILI